MTAQNHTPIDDSLLGNSVNNSTSVSINNTPQNTSGAPDEDELISHSKEAGPGRSIVPEILPVEEVVEKEHVEQELKPFIEVKPQNLKIPDDLKKMGLQPIEKAKYKDYQNIKLPLSDDKIALGMHAPITSSLRWLATFALYLLQQSHLTIKVVHGKAVRILKRE